MYNIIINTISVVIGGIISIVIAVWQSRKEWYTKENERKKRIILTGKKVYMYFFNIRNILEKVKDDNQSVREFNVCKKPLPINVDLNIIEDLSKLSEVLSESDLYALLHLYNDINEGYYKIYNYNNFYTIDSNTEYTDGADESEIVLISIDNLINGIDKNEGLINKLDNIKL